MAIVKVRMFSLTASEQCNFGCKCAFLRQKNSDSCTANRRFGMPVSQSSAASSRAAGCWSWVRCRGSHARWLPRNSFCCDSIGDVGRFSALSRFDMAADVTGNNLALDRSLQQLHLLDADPVVGNLSRFVTGATPKGDTSPPKGQLIFDASFESGNLGRVDLINDAEYDLFIRPDTCNPKYRVWYYFAVENAFEGQRVVFNVVNFSKVRTLFDTASAAPVVKSSSQSEWSRIPAEHLHYYRSPAHGDRFVLSFAFIFDGSDRFEFAYTFPYSYSRLQAYLKSIEAKRLPFFRRDSLAFTQQRRLDLLTISDVSNLSEKQRIVFITARVHPGETPASFVCHGLIDFLISADPRAVRLRAEYVFKIVPMLNPDGVYLGNYRCSLMGFDLNRHWQMPSAWAHPTVAATKNLLLQYNANTHMDLVMYIDLHAHSQRTNSFMYGNVFSKDEDRCDRQLVVPHLLAMLSDDFSLTNTQFNTDTGKAGTGRRTMGGALDASCLCYTMEVSFFSYRRNDDANVTAMAYAENKYMELGRNLALAMLHYSEVENGKRTVHFDRPFESFVPALSGKTQQQTVQNRKPASDKKNGSIRLKGVASSLSAAKSVTKANTSQ